LVVNNNGTQLNIINGTLDQSLWNSLKEGENVFEFFAEDYAGNVVLESLIIKKDTKAPVIDILDPINASWWSQAPELNIEIFDENLFSYWLIVNDNGTLLPKLFSLLQYYFSIMEHISLAKIWLCAPDSSARPNQPNSYQYFHMS